MSTFGILAHPVLKVKLIRDSTLAHKLKSFLSWDFSAGCKRVWWQAVWNSWKNDLYRREGKGRRCFLKDTIAKYLSLYMYSSYFVIFHRDVVAHWQRTRLLGQRSRVRIRHLPQWSWCAAGSLCNNVKLRLERVAYTWGKKKFSFLNSLCLTATAYLGVLCFLWLLAIFDTVISPPKKDFLKDQGLTFKSIFLKHSSHNFFTFLSLSSFNLLYCINLCPALYYSYLCYISWAELISSVCIFW